MDLSAVLTKKVKELEESGKINDMIGKAVEKLLSEIIGDLFRSYGDIGKSVKEAVAKSAGSGKLDLPEYGAFVAQIIKERYGQALTATASENIQRLIKNELKPAPEVIKASGIMEKITELWSPIAYEFNKDEIVIESSVNDDETAMEVKIRHPEYDWEDIAITIYDFKNKGKWYIGYIKTNNKCLTSSAINQASQCLSGLPAFIFKLWVARTIIEMDEEFETVYVGD